MSSRNSSSLSEQYIEMMLDDYGLMECAGRCSDSSVMLYGTPSGKSSTLSSSSQPPGVSTTPVTIPRKPFSDLDDVMEALKDPTICNIGMCYSRQGADEIIASEAVDRIKRRSEKDNLFGSIVMVTVNKNPKLTEIQHQIADEIGIRLDYGARKGIAHKVMMKIIPDYWCGKKAAVIISENAKKISEAIHNHQQQQMKTLFILSNLHEKLDLEKLGIPSGVANSGYKFIFTSESEELLSNHMNPDLLYIF